MFTAFERRDRILLRTTLAATWVLLAVGAVLGFLTPTPTLQVEVGEVIARSSAVVVVFFALGAAAGVALSIEWFEWTASYFVAAGVLPYVVAVWASFVHDPSRGQPGGYLTALLGFALYRGFANAAYARRRRIIFETLHAERARLAAGEQT